MNDLTSRVVVEMTDEGHQMSKAGEAKPDAFLVLALTLGFFGLSILSRRIYPVFALVVLMGIGTPLALGGVLKDLQSLTGFKRDVWRYMAWGVGAGVVSGLIGLPLLGELAFPDDLRQQLLIGVPLWLLVISPFQEFFFRGMVQAGLTAKLGKWMGLLTATLCFTAWHYLSPIVDLTPFPLESWAGLLSTLAAGAVYGYAYQRTQNIVAPWLAHAISGLSFILLGAMDVVQGLT